MFLRITIPGNGTSEWTGTSARRTRYMPVTAITISKVTLPLHSVLFLTAVGTALLRMPFSPRTECSAKPIYSDRVYARYSYNHQQGHTAPPLGPVLDGSGYGSFENAFLAENGMFSETHIFRPTFVNEFRFGYNWGDFKFVQPNANTDIATQLGMGGLPYTPGYGGLPSVSVSGITSWGTNGFEPMTKTQNVYQILDNVTKILGNHSLKFGVALENIRFGATLGGTKHGAYSYTGLYTSSPKSSIPTGSGMADFLVNQMHNTSITNTDNVDDQESYNSAYG